ncbi:serine protease persephone-like [Contarinia nasturtii]|uniref:serine protease persephone-like n=1 Tax=Contarinia nasturtii TaxID=265458 RepID=UPI0012D390B9|nr:serine protease persephone-like [Contarinia nasturtii]
MAQLSTMPLLQCNATVIEWNKIPNSAQFRNGLIDGQYCAYNPEGIRDACHGDSGGPLQYFNGVSSVAKIVGVVSFGIVCGGTTLPGIYTRVANYLDWIEPIVWPNQPQHDHRATWLVGVDDDEEICARRILS